MGEIPTDFSRPAFQWLFSSPVWKSFLLSSFYPSCCYCSSYPFAFKLGVLDLLKKNHLEKGLQLVFLSTWVLCQPQKEGTAWAPTSSFQRANL